MAALLFLCSCAAVQFVEDSIGQPHARFDGIVLVCQHHDTDFFRRHKRHVGTESVGRAGLVDPGGLLVRLWWIQCDNGIALIRDSTALACIMGSFDGAPR